MIKNIPVLFPGDIFLSNLDWFGGKIINKYQKIRSQDNNSEFSHAGTILNSSATTLESLWTIKNQNLYTAYKGEQILIARHKEMTPGKFVKGYKAVEKHIGQIYPFWRIPMMIIPALTKYIHITGIPLCSELVVKQLYYSGIETAGKWSGKTPDMIHDMIKFHKGWQIIFQGEV